MTSRREMAALAESAVASFGAIDVIVNNAGVMPLAFFADHAEAAEAWDRCIDINLKGVLHGISAVHDQTIEQGTPIQSAEGRAETAQGHRGPDEVLPASTPRGGMLGTSSVLIGPHFGEASITFARIRSHFEGLTISRCHLWGRAARLGGG